MTENYRQEVGAIFFDEDHNFLVVNAKSYKAGQYSITKGGLLEDEKDLDGLKREMGEELGSKFHHEVLKQSEYIKTTIWPEEIQKKDGRIGSKLKIFFVEFHGGEIEIDPNEIIDYKWISEDEFWKLMEGKGFDVNILKEEFSKLKL